MVISNLGATEFGRMNTMAPDFEEYAALNARVTSDFNASARKRIDSVNDRTAL